MAVVDLIPSAAFRISNFMHRSHLSMSTSPKGKSMFEVEQKFMLVDAAATKAMELKLVEMGMTKIGNEENSCIVDWYFDLEEPTLAPLDNPEVH